jgi:bifunctional non-homologous end joining protein LigD
MLVQTTRPARGDGWAAEVKWDGMRAQVRLDRGSLTLRSRTGRDWTERFPELEALAEAERRRRTLLDAEVVCLDNSGRPDFGALRRRLAGSHADGAVTVMIFDVLHLDGRAVRVLPLR